MRARMNIRMVLTRPLCKPGGACANGGMLPAVRRMR